jgi:hypothetical protein
MPSAIVLWAVWLAPGPEQAANGSESNRQRKVDPASLDENVKVGVESAVRPVGPESICVAGGVESSR